MAQILEIEDLKAHLKRHRGLKKIGLVTGCFDLIHSGHIELFRFGKNNVDILICGVEPDEYLYNIKGKERPILNLQERLHIISEFNSIDYVLPLTQDTGINQESVTTYHVNLLNDLRPDILITSKSADPYYLEKQKRIERLGGKILLWEAPRINSTTNIINKIKSYKEFENPSIYTT